MCNKKEFSNNVVNLKFFFKKIYISYIFTKVEHNLTQTVIDVIKVYEMFNFKIK